jgi:hypothetical protein
MIVMTVLLPEKTVEIWTGIAVSRFLPLAQVWSPANYRGSVDQSIRAGKTWAFELKTAYEAAKPFVPIDLAQLRGHAFYPPHAVPVLYVLPVVPWVASPHEPVPPEAATSLSFPWWAWVVSARQLARRLSVVKSRQPTTRQGKVLLDELPFPHPYRSTWGTGMWLAYFLVKVAECREPAGWTDRSAEDNLVDQQESDRPIDTAGIDTNYFLVHVPPLDASRPPR